MLAKYFEPEEERHRLCIHEQTGITQMKPIENTKVVDGIELPFKSLDNVLTAINKILEEGGL